MSNTLKITICIVCTLILEFCFTGPLQGADDFEVADTLVKVLLLDGTRLEGQLLTRDSSSITIITQSGIENKIPRHLIKTLRVSGASDGESRFHAFDPNYSRLIIMPTAIPLQQGAGFVSDTWIFFPSMSVGVTDNIGMMVGVSFFPFARLDEQLFYLSPKIGARVTNTLSLAAGALYVHVPDDYAFGVLYTVGTLGKEDYHVTAGLGWGYYKDRHKDFEIGKTPATLIGGYLRTSETSALLFETWYMPHGDYTMKEQPAAIGVRLFGERISVDAAVFVSYKMLKEGQLLPWLAASYNFGTLE